MTIEQIILAALMIVFCALLGIMVKGLEEFW